MPKIAWAPANRITAVYRVDLAGFNLGNFQLTTTFRGNDYEMRGEGRFSVLQGLIYRVAGHDGEQGPGTSERPGARDVRAELSDGGDKSQQLRMTFDGGGVTSVSHVPKNRPNPARHPQSPRSSSKACSIR